jgi:hypothetical protein
MVWVVEQRQRVYVGGGGRHPSAFLIVLATAHLQR